MTIETTSSETDSLNLDDLLVDKSKDVLSEYLSVSIENLGVGAKISVTTVEDHPATYSSVLTGVTLNDLHCLAEVPMDS